MVGEVRLETNGAYVLGVEGSACELTLTLSDETEGSAVSLIVPEPLLYTWRVGSDDVRGVAVVSRLPEQWRLCSYGDRTADALILLLSNQHKQWCRLVIPMTQIDLWCGQIRRAKSELLAEISREVA